jgi:hypothetical protein
MKNCPCCGAVVAEGDRVCSQCGTLLEQKSQYSRGEAPAQDSVQQPVQQPVQTQPPVWAQYGGQPTGNPTFYVPKRPLSKGGAITMIVFGAILLVFVLVETITFIFLHSEGRIAYVTWAGGFAILIPLITLLAGGLLLLLFGIRKLKNVKRYNASLNDPQ